MRLGAFAGGALIADALVAAFAGAFADALVAAAFAGLMKSIPKSDLFVWFKNCSHSKSSFAIAEPVLF
jgi:hypothetical protein